MIDRKLILFSLLNDLKDFLKFWLCSFVSIEPIALLLNSLIQFKMRNSIIFILICFFCQITIAEIETREQKFTIKKDFNKLALELAIPDKHIIYSIYQEEIGLPTKIELSQSQNLKSYKLLWPNPLFKISETGKKIHFYENHVQVPLIVQALDPAKDIELEFNIEYLLCGSQCELKKERLPVVVNMKDIPNNSEMGDIWSILWIMSLGVLGGIILNFMPCVLPVLSLKLMSFVRYSDLNRKKALIFTIAGIVTSFWVISFIAIIFKNADKYFGLGLNFQEPVFVIAMAIMITFFISISLDRVIFRLPESINKLLLNTKFQAQYAEHYFSGIAATILSTPCTAPFLGSALFLSFQQNNLCIFFTFTFIAIGFSMPYIFLLIWPETLKFLPKSGKWMVNLKLILVVLLMGTIFWLFFILEAQINLRAVIILFLLLLLIKFILENDKYILKYFVVKLIVLSILMIFAFLLPKYSYLEDQESQKKFDNLWQEFDPDKIDSLIKDGKIVFVDITANWCITCKYNKYFVFSREKFIKILSDHQIIAMQGDFTNYNLQIHDFLAKRNSPGVPYNVIFSQLAPQGIELPVLLSVQALEAAIISAK